MDIAKDCSPTIALVSYGASDIWLHGNPTILLYRNTYERTGNTQFTYKTEEFVDGCAYLKCIDDKYGCDHIGECYFDFKTEKDDITLCFTSIEFHVVFNGHDGTIVDNILETISYEAIMCFDKKYRVYTEKVQDGFHHMLSIPFFFTKHSESFFPVFMTNKLKHIYVKINDIAKEVQSPYLVFKSIILDTPPKRELMPKIENMEIKSRVVCITKSHVYSNEKITNNTLIISISNLHCVKDIRLLIRDSVTKESKKYIKSATLKLNNHNHMSLNSLMGYIILPENEYKNTQYPNIFCMSFCADPLEEKYTHTSDIRFDRVDKPELFLDIQEEYIGQTVDIVLLYREYNMLRIGKGICGITYIYDDYHWKSIKQI